MKNYQTLKSIEPSLLQFTYQRICHLTPLAQKHVQYFYFKTDN